MSTIAIVLSPGIVKLFEPFTLQLLFILFLFTAVLQNYPPFSVIAEETKSTDGLSSLNTFSTMRSPLLSRENLSRARRSNRRGPHVGFALSAVTALSLLCVIPIRTSPKHSDSNIFFSRPQSNPLRDPVVFAVIGDWGRRGFFGQNETAQALANVIPSDTSYIISAGDNFYESGVTSLYDPQFRHSFESIYSQSRIRQIPWYLVLGNHDHFGSVNFEVQYSLISPRWNMPARYYSKWLSRELLSIFIDTTPFSRTPAGTIARTNPDVDPVHQLSWLASVLSACPTNTRFLIVGHHNMYSVSVADHQGDRGVRESLEPILLPYFSRIVAYIAGHEHSLMHMQPYALSYGPFSNIDHFLSGAGSKLRPIVPAPRCQAERWRTCCGVLVTSRNETVPRTVWSQSINGFFVFHIRGDKFSATAFDSSSNVIYHYNKTLPPL